MTKKTKEISIGEVKIGAGNPIAVQSMLDVDTCDVALCLEKIETLKDVGCEIIRLAIPNSSALPAFAEICAASPLPVVADIHFDYKLACAAAKSGASKLRINPGNIGGIERALEVAAVASENSIPIRIGVNEGSLDKAIRLKDNWTPAEKLAASAEEYVRVFEKNNFIDLVISAKSHNVMTTIEAYRLISREIPHVPLHLGVTEAGTLRQGTVKSSIGLGALLLDGIGDTIRVSLTADLRSEVLVAWDILSALELRRRNVEIISCPTCARCEVDLREIAEEVETRAHSHSKPVSIAVMGCAVNGPGEAKNADIGIAFAGDTAVIFKSGEILTKVKSSNAVEELLKHL